MVKFFRTSTFRLIHFKNLFANGNKQFHFVLVTIILIGLVCGSIFIHLLKYQQNYRHECNEKAFQVEKRDRTTKGLDKKVRILCFILTSPKFRRQSAAFVRETWGKRCNILLFTASYSDNELPTVVLPSPEGYNLLWNKTKESFKYVFEKYEGKYDWVLKADDDTYTIMENLRFLLKDFDSRKPLIFGNNGYLVNINGSNRKFMHGGEGYVLSKEAVRRFVKDGIIGKVCDNMMNYSMEDVGTTMCTKKLGVVFGSSYDHRHRSRYIGSFLNETFTSGTRKTFTLDFNRYSDTPIGFHHMSTSDMVLMEYLLYHVRVEVAPSGFP